MECPFCTETVRDESLVCKHCSRDLRVALPVIVEIQEVVFELDRLRSELGHVNAKLGRLRHPLRTALVFAATYFLIPAVLLVAAHVLVTIVLNVSPLYLRLASVIIPLPFGLVLYAREKVGIRGALLLGIATATFAIFCMLTVTGLNDNVPIIPGPWIEWREAIEYALSIALAFVTGNILGFLVFQALPKIVAGGGKPNALAYNVARALGQHVGEDQLRRRARVIQNLMRTIGPLTGIVVTASGSLYAGLKGVFGW
jgi:hypothetical protein